MRRGFAVEERDDYTPEEQIEKARAGSMPAGVPEGCTHRNRKDKGNRSAAWIGG
jgi:hypothetical protein